MPLPPLPASLGRQVTTRQFNLLEMVSRAWGGEFSAPDHRVYCFGGGVRCFDSTDLGFTGIYQRPSTPVAAAPVLSGSVVSANVVLTWTPSTIAGSTITNYVVYRSVDAGAFSLLTTVGNVLTYTDVGPASGHTYHYFVVAVPLVGLNSPASNTVTETIASPGFVLSSVASGPPPTCPCPCAPAHKAGFSGTGFESFGSISPSSLTGHQIGMVEWTGLLGEGFSTFQVIVYGNVPQNFFATLTITDADLGPVTYTTAAATNYGLTIDSSAQVVTFWQWTAAYATPPIGTGTYHVTVT